MFAFAKVTRFQALVFDWQLFFILVILFFLGVIAKHLVMFGIPKNQQVIALLASYTTSWIGIKSLTFGLILFSCGIALNNRELMGYSEKKQPRTARLPNNTYQREKIFAAKRREKRSFYFGKTMQLGVIYCALFSCVLAFTSVFLIFFPGSSEHVILSLIGLSGGVCGFAAIFGLFSSFTKLDPPISLLTYTFLSIARSMLFGVTFALSATVIYLAVSYGLSVINIKVISVSSEKILLFCFCFAALLFLISALIGWKEMNNGIQLSSKHTSEGLGIQDALGAAKPVIEESGKVLIERMHGVRAGTSSNARGASSIHSAPGSSGGDISDLF